MNNSEILYLYDAKLTNPNGDPDEENRPRMDYDRSINLVSDLRLKRYIRDYMILNGEDIFVTGVNGEPVTADKRISELPDKSEDWILSNWRDVRLFGATMTVKKDNRTYIGPVQFNWGYSLNEVELLEASITSHFSSSESATQGTIGKDFRVKYSLISFFGVISGNRAEKTRLTEEDVKFLDKAMKYAIPNLATRSKIGQYPRLYLRVEYIDNKTMLGDFRDLITLNINENFKDVRSIKDTRDIRDIEECELDITKLVEKLEKERSRINKIYYFHDDNLELTVNGEKARDLKEVLSQFNLIEIE
ncbi:type I-B CRISPR-associated protein Cas7/Csh2 [Soehngenia saccharolytica]|nr:type I-B CRISPR-associated protein Cas7/Csh2 [Soehngenia saccharolytica]